MKKILLTSAVVLALLNGCNNDYDGRDIVGSKLVVLASIDQVKTRVSDTEWAVNDAIGVSDNLSTNPNVNIKYVAGSTTGNFTSTTGIYILGSEPVTYTAYYPYNGVEGTSGGEIDFSIVDGSGKYVGSSVVDFMFAQGASASRENPQVNFTFKHMMSKLKLDFKDSGAATTKADSPISYTLRGVTVDGKFNTVDGSVTPGTTKGNVTVETTLGTASSVILPPASDENQEEIQLVITVGDKIYSGTFKPALDASQEYQYSIDLSKTESGEKLQIDSPTIDGWRPNDGGNIGVEEEINLNSTLEIGDFFCNDGTTIDKNYDLSQLKVAMKNSIVGVVFYLGDPTSNDSDPILLADYPQCSHGLVVALNNANTESAIFGTKGNGIYGWLSAKKTEESSGYSAYLTTQSTKEATPSSPSTRIQGYNNTKQFVLATMENGLVSNEKTDTWSQSCDGMIAQLNTYKASASVSGASSSDWYLPSWYELEILKENYSSIEGSFASIGTALTTYETFTSASPNDCFYWSSTERAANIMWVSPLFATDEKQQASRTSGKGYFRFVLAF